MLISTAPRGLPVLVTIAIDVIHAVVPSLLVPTASTTAVPTTLSRLLGLEQYFLDLVKAGLVCNELI